MFSFSKQQLRESEERYPGQAAVSPCLDCWIKFIVVDEETERRIPHVVLLLKPPDGPTRPFRTNERGELHLADIACGFWELKNAPQLQSSFVNEQVIRATTQGVVSPVDIESLDEVPADHADEVNRMDEEDETVSAQVSIVSKIIEHSVQTGDRLDALAQTAGWTEEQLLEFNFGPLQGLLDRRQALIAGLGVRQLDESGQPVFSGNEEPGRLWYLDQGYSAQLETEKVHVIRVSAVLRPFRLELETVDELGHRLPNQSIRLIPTSGQEISLQTNTAGYWSEENISVAGHLRVESDTNDRLYFAFGGQYRTDLDRPQPMINPLLVYRGLITIVRQRRTDEVRRRRRELRQRYFEPGTGGDHVDNADADIRHPSVLERISFRPGINPNGSEVAELDGPPEQPNRRRFRNSTDNVFVAAGWREGQDQPPIDNLVRILRQFILDYHPTASDEARQPKLLIVIGRQVLAFNPDGVRWDEFELTEGYEIRDYGGYVSFVRNNRLNPFLDIVESRFIVSRVFAHGQAFPTQDTSRDDSQDDWLLENLLTEASRTRFHSFQDTFPINMTALYVFPPDYGTWSLLSRHGGSGFLEEYPQSRQDQGLFDRIHRRNMMVMEEVRVAYEAYLSWYENQLDGFLEEVENTPAEPDADGVAPTRDARLEQLLLQLGPPNSPFSFPLPASLDPDIPVERDAIIAISRANSRQTALPAFIKIARYLDIVWNRQSDGSIRFLATFEPEATGRLHVGPHFDTQVDVARMQALAGYGRVRKIKLAMNYGFDPVQEQIFQDSERTYETGHDLTVRREISASALSARIREVHGASISSSVETNEETGDFENKINLKIQWRGGNNVTNRFAGRQSDLVDLEITDTGKVDLILGYPPSLRGFRITHDSAGRNTYFGYCHVWSGPGTSTSVGGAGASVDTEMRVCVGARIQALSSDSVRGFFSPHYFFGGMNWSQIVSHGMTWNHLTQDVQEALIMLGWTNPDIWDRRHNLSEDEWPLPPLTRWHDLHLAERAAASDLGIRRASWTASWQRINGWPGIQGGVRLQDDIEQNVNLIQDNINPWAD